jgi:RimJ/RimL family protein N-acetyltransferase
MNREIIEATGVRLRLFHDLDVDDLAAGCDDALTRLFLPRLPDPYTGEDARWWITEGTAASWAGGGAAYAIADPVTDRLLGGIGIEQVMPNRAQGEVGYWVAPWARGRGVATAATTALAGRALAHGFARLELLCDPENVASQRVALGAGFQREGMRRGGGTGLDDSRHDLVAWARLATDPPGPAARILPDLPDACLTDGVVTLRPLTAADGEFVHRLQSLPDVVATGGPRPRRGRATVRPRAEPLARRRTRRPGHPGCRELCPGDLDRTAGVARTRSESTARGGAAAAPRGRPAPYSASAMIP